jgi:hypothetical protein
MKAKLKVNASSSWCVKLEAGFTSCQRQLSVPAGVVHLDEIEEVAACGPVGGGKAAYVMAKLPAAAAWKELSLDRQVLSVGSSSSAGSSSSSSICNKRLQQQRGQ